MQQEINLLDLYPKSKRPIAERGSQISEAHRAVARRFDREFFDGNRLTGYGGYNYHPRFWTDTVARIRDHYHLRDDAAVLDVGCGKGFMMYDFKQLMPALDIRGIDVSRYAFDNAKPEVKSLMQVADAKELPFPDRHFDLVISINTIHNLPIEQCKQALREIQRVTRGDAFVTVDAWRNDAERKAMLDWNLTALTYMHVDDWRRLLAEVGYQGDYWWFIAESA